MDLAPLTELRAAGVPVEPVVEADRSGFVAGGSTRASVLP